MGGGGRARERRGDVFVDDVVEEDLELGVGREGWEEDEDEEMWGKEERVCVAERESQEVKDLMRVRGWGRWEETERENGWGCGWGWSGSVGVRGWRWECGWWRERVEEDAAAPGVEGETRGEGIGESE